MTDMAGQQTYRRDRLRDAAAAVLYRMADRVGAPDRTSHLSRCPDCGIGPDLGEDVECSVCRDAGETRKVQEAVYAAGYEDARSERHELDGEGR